MSWALVPLVAAVLLALHGPAWWSRSRSRVPVAWGVVGLLGAGGIGMLAGFALPVATLALAVGFALAVAALLTRRVAPVAALPPVLAGTAAAVAVLPAASRLPYNVYDDLASYLYLAQRIRVTGTLVDAFDGRRLATLGGSDFLHALVLPVAGTGGIHAMDALFAPAVLAALIASAVPAGAGLWRRAGAAVAGLLLASFLIAPRDNTSPYITSLVICVAAGLCAWEALEQPGTAPVLLLGGLSACAVILRTTLAVALFPVVAAVAVKLLRHRMWRSFSLLVAGAVVPVLPWSAVAWRSGRAPLYPLTPGNQDPAFSPYRSDAPGAVHAALASYLHYPQAVRVDVIALGCVAAAVLAVRNARTTIVLTLALLGGFLTAVLVSTSLTLGVRWDFYRYSWAQIASVPVTCAVLLLAQDHRPLREAGSRVWHGAVARAGVLGVAAVLIVAAVPVAASGEYAASPQGTAFWRIMQDRRTASTGSAWDGTSAASATTLYRAAQSRIPAGARVLSMTDFPWAFDLRRNDFAAIDMIGFASPGSHLPLSGAPGSIWSYLLHQGYRYAIVVDPDADLAESWPGHLGTAYGVLSRAHFEGPQTPPFSGYAPTYLRVLTGLRTDLRPGRPGLQRVGPLWVVDLRAQAPYLRSLGLPAGT